MWGGKEELIELPKHKTSKSNRATEQGATFKSQSEYSLKNGLTLCEKCHREVHRKKRV